MSTSACPIRLVVRKGQYSTAPSTRRMERGLLLTFWIHPSSIDWTSITTLEEIYKYGWWWIITCLARWCVLRPAWRSYAPLSRPRRGRSLIRWSSPMWQICYTDRAAIQTLLSWNLSITSHGYNIHPLLLGIKVYSKEILPATVWTVAKLDWIPPSKLFVLMNQSEASPRIYEQWRESKIRCFIKPLWTGVGCSSQSKIHS